MTEATEATEGTGPVGPTGQAVPWSRRLLPAAVLLTALIAWGRDAVYAASRGDVVAAVATSSRVTDDSRETVMRVQDGLQYGWLGFPVLLLLLALVAAILKIGQALLIAVSGAVSTILAMGGILLPSTATLVALSVAFLVGTITTVAAALLPGRS